MAIAWHPENHRGRTYAAGLGERAKRSAARWLTACAADDLLVLHRSRNDQVNTVYPLDRDCGVVLGHLFARSHKSGSIPAQVDLSGAATDRIVSSGGRELLSRYWGRYVACLRDDRTRNKWVIRDPSGNLQCFWMEAEGCHIYFSRLDELMALTDVRCSYNWRYLEGFMRFGAQNSGATGLNEVREVLAGECIQHDHSATWSRRFYWNPIDFATQNPIEDPQEAVQSLREVTSACVHAWASCHDTILHRLSGGLDSAIVLACLKSAPSNPNVVCLNYHSPGSDTDERHFARQMAELAGCELIERQRRSSTDMSKLLSIGHTPYPFFYMAYLDCGREEVALAQQHGATALFSGGGGDNLFYIGASIPEAADYAYTRGIDSTLLRKALESSLMLNCSIWRTLSQVVRFGILRRRPHLIDEREQQYVLLRVTNEHNMDADTAYFHPLIVAAAGIPPAKLEHASAIAWEVAPRYDPFETDIDPLETIPLISQPLIELSLAIPTHILTLNGRDRSIARRAFERDLPPRILRRKTKGGQEEHIKSVLMSNKPLLRELLPDGELVRAGYIDRAALQAALDYSPTTFKCDPGELVAILFLEAWLQSWSRSLTASTTFATARHWRARLDQDPMALSG